MKKVKKEKTCLERGHGHPRGDRHQDVPVREHGPDLGEDRRDVLRLDGDEDDVRGLDDLFLIKVRFEKKKGKKGVEVEKKKRLGRQSSTTASIGGIK